MRSLEKGQKRKEGDDLASKATRAEQIGGCTKYHFYNRGGSKYYFVNENDLSSFYHLGTQFQMNKLHVRVLALVLFDLFRLSPCFVALCQISPALNLPKQPFGVLYFPIILSRNPLVNGKMVKKILTRGFFPLK